MSLRQYIVQQNEQQMFGVACAGDDFWCSSACLELDQTAQIISYEEYHPLGTTSYRSGRTETEVSLKRYKYVGKERDEETGLYYYGARYYAAWLCRFVSVDPLQFDYPYYTPYQYAGNKPISYIDLDGLEEWLSPNQSFRRPDVMGGLGTAVNYSNQITVKANFFLKQLQRPDLSKISNVSNVLEGKKWIQYNSLLVKPKSFLFINYGKEEYRGECADYARSQVKQGDGSGEYTPVGSNSRIDMYVDYKRQTNSPVVDLQKGVDVIISNLKLGRAVMAGVMYDSEKNTGNANVATNHFVTIVGMGIDKQGFFFSYYDNFTNGGGESVGTDVQKNKFRLIKDNYGFYYFADSDNNIPYNANNESNVESKPKTYVLTEIRNNL